MRFMRLTVRVQCRRRHCFVSEYLHTPGPRSKTASQFGHLCRMLSLYQTLEAVIGELAARMLIRFLAAHHRPAPASSKDPQARAPALAACRDAMNVRPSPTPSNSLRER